MKSSFFILVFSFLTCAILFSEQYSQRGGIVNYPKFTKAADQVRMKYQNTALHMIQDRPFLGVGYQLFSVETPRYESETSKDLTSVHNIYLLLASETGLFSLIAFLFWIAFLTIRFFNSKKDSLTITLFSSFLGILFIGGCDFYPLTSHQGAMLFFSIAGLLYGCTPDAKKKSLPLEKSYSIPQTHSEKSISQMFDRISPTYDRVNRILSLGLDLKWRRKMARFLPSRKNLHLLDLATGTADQLISLFEAKAPIGSAVGLDLASEMLLLGEKKIQTKSYAQQIELQVGDAMAIPFEKDQFDACTFSFGIRNVKDPLISLEEIHRVLKPEGRCLVLEFSLPLNPIKGPYLFYLRHCLPWLGGKLSKHPEAYRYLNRTIESFPSGQAFLSLMKQAGFKKMDAHPMALGAVTLYVGEK